MRCPKCGYISFDNVEKCLKCRKNIAQASSLFQGSVLNVSTPAFLKLVPDEEEVGEMKIPQEDAEIAEEDFEIADPDLEILLDEEEVVTDEIQLDMEDEEVEGLEQSELDQLNDDLSEIKSFSEEEPAEEAAPELATLDEAEMEQAFAEDEPEEALNLEMPDELGDISDLSPPAKDAVVPEEPLEAQQAESEIDLDFANLDEEFGEEATATAAAVTAAAAVTEPKKEKEQTLNLDMDEDLDFELDLGGLSIHDEDKNE